jgi:hypothetical protein
LANCRRDVGHQRSVISYQLSVISYQLSEVLVPGSTATAEHL